MTYIATTYANIRKGAFKNIRTTLVSNVTGVGTRVYGSYPLANAVLPLVVIEGPNKEPVDESNTIITDSSRSITVNITAYAKQMEQADTIADQIESLIDSNQTVLQSYGLHFATNDPCVDVDSGVGEDVNGQRSHSRTIAVTFEIDR